MSVFMFLHVYIVPYATFIKVIVLRLFCFEDSPICLLGLYFCEAIVTQKVILCDFFFCDLALCKAVVVSHTAQQNVLSLL